MVHIKLQEYSLLAWKYDTQDPELVLDQSLGYFSYNITMGFFGTMEENKCVYHRNGEVIWTGFVNVVRKCYRKIFQLSDKYPIIDHTETYV